jgi:hypothetical protein
MHKIIDQWSKLYTKNQLSHPKKHNNRHFDTQSENYQFLQQY